MFERCCPYCKYFILINKEKEKCINGECENCENYSAEKGECKCRECRAEGPSPSGKWKHFRFHPWWERVIREIEGEEKFNENERKAAEYERQQKGDYGIGGL